MNTERDGATEPSKRPAQEATVREPQLELVGDGRRGQEKTERGIKGTCIRLLTLNAEQKTTSKHTQSKTERHHYGRRYLRRRGTSVKRKYGMSSQRGSGGGAQKSVYAADRTQGVGTAVSEKGDSRTIQGYGDRTKRERQEGRRRSGRAGTERSNFGNAWAEHQRTQQRRRRILVDGAVSANQRSKQPSHARSPFASASGFGRG